MQRGGRDVAFVSEPELIRVGADSAVRDVDPHRAPVQEAEQAAGLAGRHRSPGDVVVIVRPLVVERDWQRAPAAWLGGRVAGVDKHTGGSGPDRVRELPGLDRTAEGTCSARACTGNADEGELAAGVEAGEVLPPSVPGVDQLQGLSRRELHLISWRHADSP